MLVYSLVYVFANLGIWAIVLMMRRHEYAGERVDDFEGLHSRAPFWAFAMFIFLLSLGGIPPTAGFIGKYFLFSAAVQAGFGWLAIIAVLMSAVSMFYYLRLVVAMYLREGRRGGVAISGPLRFVAGGLPRRDAHPRHPAGAADQAGRRVGEPMSPRTRVTPHAANDNDTERRRQSATLLEASSIGWMFPIAIGIGLVIGWGLDKLFGTSPG